MRARAIFGAAALALMYLQAGCVKLAMEVAVAPDQSVQARMSIAIDKDLAAMSPGGIAESAAAKVPPGWQKKEFEEGKWHVIELQTKAQTAATLFPKEPSAPQLHIATTARRLSTCYTIVLVLPPSPATPPAGPGLEPSAGQGVSAKLNLSGLMEAIFPEPVLRIRLQGPGRVIAPAGKSKSTGAVEWASSMAELQEQRGPREYRLETEMPNWNNIGHLASQLVWRGAPPDVGRRLYEAWERGLLPNPLANAPAAMKLSAIDYLRLLEIIETLDLAISHAGTERLIGQLGLNNEKATSVEIAAVRSRLNGVALDRLAQEAAEHTLRKALQR